MQNTSQIDPRKWVEWLKAKGLSETSIKNYYFYFNKFNFEKLGQDYIISFVNKYNNSVARAFVKSILEYLKVKDIDLPKVTGRKKYREPEVLNLDEVNLISNAMRTERNKVMVLINFYGGLRVSELINIKPYDINWKKWLEDSDGIGYIKIIGKGNKQRTVFLPAILMKRVYNWIHTSGIGSKQNKEDPLFRIDVRRYQVLLSDAGFKAVQRNINPHLLRHSCATYLLNNNWNQKEIADYLGHKSTSTTSLYLHLDKKKLAEKFSKV